MAAPTFYELYRRSRYGDARLVRIRTEEADKLTHHSIGYALTDTLDDLISEHRIDPQLAMKILSNFDRAITETLQDKVKARLQFKVSGGCRPSGGDRDARGKANRWRERAGLTADTGLTGYLPVLRRGVDLLDQERDLQDGWRRTAGDGGQGQDRQLQRQTPRPALKAQLLESACEGWSRRREWLVR